MLGLGYRMQPRYFVFITLVTLCHLQLAGQVLTNALPPVEDYLKPTAPASDNPSAQLPDDPGQEALPIATPEPLPPNGVPVRVEAQRQSRVGDVLTLSGRRRHSLSRLQHRARR